MTIPEACSLVMEAAVLSNGNEIYVFDMGASVKIDHLARRMIELSGYVPDKDIKIEYSGLRPGEKLYEEVLSTEENSLPTSHERIRIAKVRDYSYAQANDYVSRMERLAQDVNIAELVKLMKEVVPEYISNNSIFQAYDK
jgi:FlaA1/EpsC-like NDP-sugar epimerase